MAFPDLDRKAARFIPAPAAPAAGDSTPPGNERPSSLGLRKVALLAGLAPADLDELAARCAWRSYRPGQHVISRESGDRDVYLVVAGAVRVTTYALSGRQTTFRDVRQGETFGELAAIDGRPRSADVVAVEDTLLASLAPGLFRNLLRERPAVAEHVLTGICALVRELSERLVDLGTLDVRNRLIAELLKRARAGRTEGNVAIIDPAPKHADLASRVSTYREQVTRELSSLVRVGVLERAGRALVVPDLARLARLAAAARGRA